MKKLLLFSLAAFAITASYAENANTQSFVATAPGIIRPTQKKVSIVCKHGLKTKTVKVPFKAFNTKAKLHKHYDNECGKGYTFSHLSSSIAKYGPHRVATLKK